MAPASREEALPL
jgi:hypothetical protein